MKWRIYLTWKYIILKKDNKIILTKRQLGTEHNKKGAENTDFGGRNDHKKQELYISVACLHTYPRMAQGCSRVERENKEQFAAYSPED